MTGYSLFKHAVLRVFRNLDDALAISGLIWIGVVAISVIASSNAPALPAGTAAWDEVSTRGLLIIFGVNLAVLVASIWVAVAWHRFVLLGARPHTIIPPFRGKLFATYLGKSLLLSMVLMAMMVGATLVITLVTLAVGSAPVLFYAMLLVLGTCLMYVFHRLSPILPAAALDETLSLKAAWATTEAHKTPIFHATILMMLGWMLLQSPVTLVGNGVIGLVFSLISGWIGLMVGVSLLSAIYEISVPKDDV